MQPFGTLKGFGVTFKHIFKKPITQQYPEFKRPVYPRFRGRHRLHRHENGLEKCVGCSLCAAACPSDCIRVVAAENTAEQPRLRRRALRAHLRDQPLALHLLRLLRARVPVRRDHARQRVRALRVLARRPDLHEGHAPRRADQADPGAGPRPLRHADPGVQELLVADGRRPRLGDLARRGGRLPRAPACASSRPTNPFSSALSLIGNLASLAVLYLLAHGRVRRRRAGARLRRRGDGDVPVRDRLPRRARRRAVRRRDRGWPRSSAVVAAVALLAGDARRDPARRGRPALGRGGRRPRLRLAGGDRPALPHRPPARVRDHLDRAARRRGRRRRARDARRDGRGRGRTREEAAA